MNNQRTILVIDDESFSRDVIEGFLYSEGYNLVFASSGVEALNRIGAINPDVILLDIIMPILNGFEVCRRLKEDKRWRHIPIVLVSSLVNKEDWKIGIEAGANEFLRKPVNELELQVRVRSMLQIKELYDRLGDKSK